jgi:molybdate transport system regulatory protein
MAMKKKEIRVRCWVDIGGVKHFGPGPAELLERIEETGSISKAAKEMGMSYKKAWDIIERMNARGQSPYVVTSKGGTEGGGTVLTPTGKKVLKSFNKLNNKIKAVVKKETELLKWV